MDKTWDTAFGKLGLRSFIRKDWIKWYIICFIIGILAALMTLYHKQIVEGLKPFANDLQAMKFGWLIPVGILFVISFPPLFGHEIITILCGLVWGLWLGFGIVALGTFLGELGNYWAFKYACTSRSKKQEEKDMNYACMCAIVREGGFWIAFLARLSAIPGHLVTPVFATTGMSLWIFSAATILSMPKQLAAVYIGTLFDEEEAGRSTTSKIIEYSVLVVAFIVTIVAAWYIYRKMGKKRPEIEQLWSEKRTAKLAEEGMSVPTVSAGMEMSQQPGFLIHPASPKRNYIDPYGETAEEKARFRDPLDPRAHYRQSEGWYQANARSNGGASRKHYDDDTDSGRQVLVANAAQPGYAGLAGGSTSTIDLSAPGVVGYRSGYPEDLVRDSEDSLGYAQAGAGRDAFGREDLRAPVPSEWSHGEKQLYPSQEQYASPAPPAAAPPPVTTPIIAFHPASMDSMSFMNPGGPSRGVQYAEDDTEDEESDNDEAFYRPRAAPNPQAHATGDPAGGDMTPRATDYEEERRGPPRSFQNADPRAPGRY